jgi:hypothetical protein
MFSLLKPISTFTHLRAACTGAVASCAASVRRFTAGDVSALVGSQFTYHWSGVTPRRALFSSVL